MNIFLFFKKYIALFILFYSILSFTDTNIEDVKTLTPIKEDIKKVEIISEEDIKKELKARLIRLSSFEFSFVGSLSRNKHSLDNGGSKSSFFSTNAYYDLTLFYLYGDYFEPGLGLSYARISDQIEFNIHARLLWNFKSIKTERFVPYMILGTGYSELTTKSFSGKFIGYYLPELKLGFRYFFFNEIAFNTNYSYSVKAFKHSSLDVKYKIIDRVFYTGISIFF